MRRSRTRDGGEARAFVRFAVCTALPMIVFFLLTSLRAPAGGNWSIAPYTSLVPLAALAAVTGSARGWWSGTVLYGAAALVAIHCPLTIARMPVVGRFVPVHRFHGTRAVVEQRAAPMLDFLERTANRGLIIAPSHNHAAFAAYYVPWHPHVASAGHFLGDRRSAYDFFPDTDLTNPALRGRPALFIGGTAAQWRAAFDCPDLWMFDARGPLFMTSRFALRPASPP